MSELDKSMATAIKIKTGLLVVTLANSLFWSPLSAFSLQPSRVNLGANTLWPENNK